MPRAENHQFEDQLSVLMPVYIGGRASYDLKPDRNVQLSKTNRFGCWKECYPLLVVGHVSQIGQLNSQ